MISYSHNRISFTHPLYDTVVAVRRGLIDAIRIGNILKAPYLGDCSARNSYDELRDNKEIRTGNNSTHHTMQ